MSPTTPTPHHRFFAIRKSADSDPLVCAAELQALASHPEPGACDTITIPRSLATSCLEALKQVKERTFMVVGGRQRAAIALKHGDEVKALKKALALPQPPTAPSDEHH